jgi:hypothetical protein
VEEDAGEEGGDVGDQHEAGGRPTGDHGADQAAEDREQREEAQRLLPHAAVAELGDVPVERAVPRHQALLQRQRWVAGPERVDGPVGDEEPEGDGHACDQPRRRGRHPRRVVAAGPPLGQGAA